MLELSLGRALDLTMCLCVETFRTISSKRRPLLDRNQCQKMRTYYFETFINVKIYNFLKIKLGTDLRYIFNTLYNKKLKCGYGVSTDSNSASSKSSWKISEHNLRSYIHPHDLLVYKP